MGHIERKFKLFENNEDRDKQIDILINYLETFNEFKKSVKIDEIRKGWLSPEGKFEDHEYYIDNTYNKCINFNLFLVDKDTNLTSNTLCVTKNGEVSFNYIKSRVELLDKANRLTNILILKYPLLDINVKQQGDYIEFNLNYENDPDSKKKLLLNKISKKLYSMLEDYQRYKRYHIKGIDKEYNKLKGLKGTEKGFSIEISFSTEIIQHTDKIEVKLYKFKYKGYDTSRLKFDPSLLGNNIINDFKKTIEGDLYIDDLKYRTKGLSLFIIP